MLLYNRIKWKRILNWKLMAAQIFVKLFHIKSCENDYVGQINVDLHHKKPLFIAGKKCNHGILREEFG